MTVYARSDVLSVSLSLDHGGCGATHTRPVTHGAPVKMWELNCPGKCENHLRHDPRWSANRTEIPETPDEVKIREDRENKGKLDYENNLQASIASLASTNDGIQKLLSVMIASQANTNPAMVEALKILSGNQEASGENIPGLEDQVFEDQALEISEIPSLEKTATKLNISTSILTGMPLKELRALMRQHGMDSSGTRAQIIERLNM